MGSTTSASAWWVGAWVKDGVGKGQGWLVLRVNGEVNGLAGYSSIQNRARMVGCVGVKVERNMVLGYMSITLCHLRLLWRRVVPT